MAKRLLQLAAGLFCGWFLALAAAAQTGGSVSGVVSDPSGAPIPGAEVTAQSESGSFLRRADTDGLGHYLIAGRGPGRTHLRSRCPALKPTGAREWK